MAKKIRKKLTDKKAFKILAPALLLVLVGLFLISRIPSNPASSSAQADDTSILDRLDAYSSSMSLQEVQGLSEGNVSVTAEVTGFSEDSQSGTKFFVLSDGTTKLQALAFKNTSLPLIEENKEYTFKGTMQRAPGDEYNELVIRTID